MQRRMAQRGLLDDFEDGVMSPMFMAGAGLLSGEGFSGALQGARAGAGFQDRRRQMMQQDQQQQALTGLLDDPNGMFNGVDPNARTFLASSPEMASGIIGRRFEQQFDPLHAFKLKMAEHEAANAPLDRQLKVAQINATNRRTPGPVDEFAQRRAQAAQMQLDPSSEDYRRFVLTGKYEGRGAESTDVSKNISQGIGNLARIPHEFGGDDGAFGSAVGPIRGQEGGVLPTIGKVWGSFTNWMDGAGAKGRTTTEVRNRIAGDVEALAAAIKPLIRKPGEGAWTDADQARLVSVVGNLALASNEEEYYRSLQGLRDRVSSNFSIDLPNVSRPGAPAPANPSTSSGVLDQARAAIQQGANRDAVIQRLRERGIEPGGL